MEFANGTKNAKLNLLYACGTCNTAKAALLNVPDPCQIAFADCLRIETNGTVSALNKSGERLTEVLRLNRDKDVNSRCRWIRGLTALLNSSPDIYDEYMGFPSDLKDLRPPAMRPPENTKPDSVNDCHFALRERGELPETY